MATANSANKHPSRYRRFWRLFRREKPSSTNVNYSYQYMMRFPRLPITVPPLVPTLMSYRWNDEDDYEPLPKKLPRVNHHQRRRLPKRYSDIVGPSSTKIYLPEKEKQIIVPLSPHHRRHHHHHHNENLYNKKSNEILCEKKEHAIVTRRYSSKNKRLSTSNAVDLLAHRMQAAMSTELMHSLDRNFVFGDKKQLMINNNLNMNRSHSFHITSNDWWEKSEQKKHRYHIIPRVKHCLDDEQKSIETIPSLDEPTPDYDEEIIIRRVKNNDSVSEEPIADYDEPEFEEQSPTHDELGVVSSSCLIPQVSITPSSETCTQEQSPIPPTPPPLPNTTIIEEKKMTFRCRTIADKITADHKLILKDESETTKNIVEKKQSSKSQIQQETPKKSRHMPSIAPQPCYISLSKEVLEKTTLRKVSHPVSRSYSTYGSMSQLNDHDTELTTLRAIDEQQPLDGLSSSATTSIVIENEYEHRASSKIYNDYKRRTSLVNVSTNNSYNYSAIIHPMHTHIGLRSSTSSPSTNDKPNDTSLSNKQMNLCVINQLNQHLSTRFHKQQQNICTNSTDQSSQEIIYNNQTNVYDEPQHIEITKCPDTSSSSIPPPPPPLPVGGFRPVTNRPSSSQRTSLITLPREINGCSTGTSTTSSKLSDTRILRELRTNPLFTKAKQHLEISPDADRSIVPYLRLDTSSQETSILIHPAVKNSPKTRINSRTFTKTQCRQSELELIFQKRAQRIEENLT